MGNGKCGNAVIDYMKALQHQTLYNVGENKKKEVLQHEKVLWM
ncbi:unnamed protein product [marine sediment metagenome]|uniref:Uncharacterized protein n=2 Tax=marine sediment metagenome TaxID=412755 RepID=X1MIL1_9ZZZZ